MCSLMGLKSQSDIAAILGLQLFVTFCAIFLKKWEFMLCDFEMHSSFHNCSLASNHVFILSVLVQTMWDLNGAIIRSRENEVKKEVRRKREEER